MGGVSPLTSLHPGITAVVVDEVDLEVAEVEAGGEEVSSYKHPFYPYNLENENTTPFPA